ncbi:hypothetical protein [Capybara microvirus Cap1_SP_159]|nr:hypothetical protein [Capybara microvirus Cap1_SP_159]
MKPDSPDSTHDRTYLVAVRDKSTPQCIMFPRLLPMGAIRQYKHDIGNFILKSPDSAYALYPEEYAIVCIEIDNANDFFEVCDFRDCKFLAEEAQRKTSEVKTDEDNN